jgi:uncharacterized membrane protein YdjX (TVP38/TMEM64 family)
MRIWILFIGLAVLFAVPFVLFGENFDEWLDGKRALEWLKGYGAWAWAMAVALLVGDLLLPIPATAVMAALGMLYGPVAGGLIGGAGSMLSGIVAYLLCRHAGRGAALRLAGEEELKKGERFFARSGGFAVALSRWMPLMPEVIACMAGLVRMKAAVFLAALACGSLPMAFAFACLGHLGTDKPALALAASAVIPLVLWTAARRLVRR